jgi:hypothetical protein
MSEMYDAIIVAVRRLARADERQARSSWKLACFVNSRRTTVDG